MLIEMVYQNGKIVMIKILMLVPHQKVKCVHRGSIKLSQKITIHLKGIHSMIDTAYSCMMISLSAIIDLCFGYIFEQDWLDRLPVTHLRVPLNSALTVSPVARSLDYYAITASK